MTTNNFTTVELVLGGAVATSGTFLINYPTGKSLANYENAYGHYFLALGAKFTQPDDFTIVFGATYATVTYKGTTTLPAGTKVTAQLEEVGLAAPKRGYVDDGATVVTIDKLRDVKVFQIDLGAPAAIDVDGIIEAYTGAASAIALDGALVSDGVATLDVPRNLVVDSGGADDAVLTFTGTDEYGQTMIESITLNGATAVSGKKAFKTVTAVSASKALANGAFVGTGDVLGLPVYLPAGAYVLAELEDGAAASSGALVAGLAPNTVSTATTADVRGTYDPNSACDAAKSFSLLVSLADPEYLGNPQYSG